MHRQPDTKAEHKETVKTKEHRRGRRVTPRKRPMHRESRSIPNRHLRTRRRGRARVFFLPLRTDFLCRTHAVLWGQHPVIFVCPPSYVGCSLPRAHASGVVDSSARAPSIQTATATERRHSEERVKWVGGGEERRGKGGRATERLVRGDSE